MKQIRKVIQIGNSKAITIDSEIVDKLGIKEGSLIETDIEMLNINKELKSYSCKACLYQFDSNEEHPYCPACECEDLVINGVEK